MTMIQEIQHHDNYPDINWESVGIIECGLWKDDNNWDKGKLGNCSL